MIDQDAVTLGSAGRASRCSSLASRLRYSFKVVFLFNPYQLPAEAAPDRRAQPPQTPLARVPFGALPPCSARLLSGLVDPSG
jgi:hypothetical protein